MPLGVIKATPASAFPHQNIAMQVLLGTPGIENDYTCARLQESNNRLTKKRALPSQKNAHCIRYQKHDYTRMSPVSRMGFLKCSAAERFFVSSRSVFWTDKRGGGEWSVEFTQKSNSVATLAWRPAKPRRQGCAFLIIKNNG